MRILIFLLSLLVTVSGPTSFALPEAKPAASGVAPAALDLEFLNLPAYDVSWAEGTSTGPAKPGDSLRLKITGITQPQFKLEVPEGSSSLQELGWEVRPLDPSPSSIGSGASTGPGDSYFAAIPLKAGKLTLPSLLIKDSNGKNVARTRPFSIEVGSAIQPNDPNPTQPAAPEPPVSLQFPWWVAAIFTVLGAALAIGLFYFAYRYWKSRKPKEKPLPPIVPRPEDEVALAQLTALEQAGLVKKGEYKAHYFGVSEILKSYIGLRYRFDAPECTTSEMIRVLENKSATSDGVLDDLETLFTDLDQVKFTDHIPQDATSVKVLEAARSFVLRTRKPQSKMIPPQEEAENAVR